MVPDIVAIGGSAGSLEALELLLPRLPESPRSPLVVIVHQHRTARGDLIAILQNWSSVPVQPIMDKDRLVPGRLHVCPADYHTLVEPDRTFALSTDEPVHFARPSIDVLFESAARAFGDRVVGVLLSGANADGAEGLAAIRARGGKTACQDPATAREPTMPRAGCAATTIDWIGAPDVLGDKLAKVLA